MDLLTWVIIVPGNPAVADPFGIHVGHVDTLSIRSALLNERAVLSVDGEATDSAVLVRGVRRVDSMTQVSAMPSAPQMSLRMSFMRLPALERSTLRIASLVPPFMMTTLG